MGEVVTSPSNFHVTYRGYFLWYEPVNDQTEHPMISNRRCTWMGVHVTPEAIQMRRRPFVRNLRVVGKSLDDPIVTTQSMKQSKGRY